LSEHGTSELLRDNRGFSVRFYGEEEIWDIVGLNTPIQWIDMIDDTMLFHDSMIKNTYKNLLDHTDKWNFINKTLSGLHVMTMIYSDRGIPKGWQHMNGYGCNTTSLIDKDGNRTWIKFHFKTQQGHDWYSEEEAAKISFDYPDKMTVDMVNLINSKNFPKWKVYIQMMEEDKYKDLNYNVFSSTNIWPHADFPLIEIGEFELNQLPNDQMEEFEKMALAPGNIPKGMGLSPDFSLTARVDSYPKLQQIRLGKKINELPTHIRKDMDLYKNNIIWLECQNRQDEEYYYSQPRALWNLFDKNQKSRLHKNIAKALSRADKSTIDKIINRLMRIDPRYGKGVLKELGKLNV
jgi:catalase